MKVLTAAQIKRAEEKAVSMGDSFFSLMEKAGAACAEVLIKRTVLSEKPQAKITLVCGRGKNGGDGFVIARRLHGAGFACTVVLACGAPSAEDSIGMFKKLPDVKVIDYTLHPDEAAEAVAGADILVDSIIGFGFHGVPKPALAEVIGLMNRSAAPIAAIDLPTGLDCDLSDVNAECIHAKLTIAISTLKPAHVMHPAAAYCGEVVTVSIGMPEECFSPDDTLMRCIDKPLLHKYLKPRKSDANKGNFGKVLCVCGSKRMPGAAVLAATGSVRGGAGLVTAAFPECIYTPLTAHLTEPTFLPLPENKDGSLSVNALGELQNALQKATVCLAGCGMSVTEDTKKIVNELIKTARCPLLIDADGINCLSDNIDILKAAKTPLILTPHPGEMSRLCGKSVAEIQASRVETAVGFAKEHGVILVLKGAGTIVTDGEKIYINPTGNPGMAKGGSGDALAGIVCAVIAQGVPPLEAAACGVYLHGAAGDSAAEASSQRGMTATDLLNRLPLLLSEYEQQGDA